LLNHNRAWAEVNLSHIAHNTQAIRGIVPARTSVIAVVKADAYGHGMIPVARTVLENGADSLGVALCEEGMALREAGITAPVLVMGATPEPMMRAGVRLELTQSVFSAAGARDLSSAAKQHNKRAQIHIKIDTGMGRLGFPPTPAGVDAICEIARDPRLDVGGIFTHCATADMPDNDFVHEQHSRFTRLLDELKERGLDIPVKHMCNSAATARKHPGFFMDAVRVGIMLYGLLPSPEMAEICRPLALKPAMGLFAQVTMVKELPAGVGISYGHRFTTARPSRIAVISIGYADGYPRRLTNIGRVMIRGRPAPIAGTVCMDQCMADVTGIPGAAPGDTVALLGTTGESLCADALAGLLGTINYEIVCGIGKRVPRVYTNEN